ncbi:MAG: hypothetical protein HQL59_03785 [Magnetococcales bacterium]|nr:hypothetical protein [Magnetococcales bacterium]
MELLKSIESLCHLAVAVSSVTLMAAHFVLFLVQYRPRTEGDSSADLAGRVADWFLWPVRAFRAFFDGLFGGTRTRISRLFSWRSLGVTLAWSLGGSLLALLMVLGFVPPEMPPWEPRMLRVLWLSFLVYSAGKFLGDFVVIGVTRHLLNLASRGRLGLSGFLLGHGLGVAAGVLLALSPALVPLLLALTKGIDLHPFLEKGGLGGLLIPFLLYTIVSSDQAMLTSSTVLAALSSMFVPLAIFVLLVGSCFIGKRVHDALSRFIDWRNGSAYLLSVIGIMEFILYAAMLSILLVTIILYARY